MAFENGPVVKLADVPVMAQRIEWTLASGTTPGELSLSFVPEQAQKFLDTAKGRETLNFSIETSMEGFRGGLQRVSILFPPLFLLEPDGSQSPYETHLRLTDLRVLLQGIRVYGTYNLRRETAELEGIVQDADGTRSTSNDLGLGIDPPGRAASSSGDGGIEPGDQRARPGAMRRREARAKKDYLEWTIKKDGTPYTAREIAVHVLEEASSRSTGHALTKQTVDAILDAIKRHPLDNGYVRDDVMVRNEPLVDVLDSWLAKAEVGFAPSMRHAVEFYAWWTADDRPINEVLRPFYPTVEAGGFISVTEKERVRASAVDVRFPRQVEALIRLMGDSRLPGEPGGPADDEPYRRAYNVLRLTDDVKYLDQVWYKGTWVSLSFAIELWVNNSTNNLNRLLDDVNFKDQIRRAGVRGADWSKFIRENWFNTQFMSWLGSSLIAQAGGGLVAAPDQIWGPRIAELQRRYLQTWRLDPTFFQFVLEIKPERTKMVSAIHGVPANAYVSVDHCEIYEFSIPEIVRNPLAKGAINVSGEISPRDAVGTPATLRFEQPDVFTINFDSFYEGRWLKQTVPCKIKESTIPPAFLLGAVLSSGNPDVARVWENAELVNPVDYRGFVILSFVMGTVANPRVRDLRHGVAHRRALSHAVRVPAAAAGFTGPTNPEIVVDLDSREETARFALDGNLNVELDPVNEKSLEALAVAHARRYYHEQRDRIQGVFVVPGWQDEYHLFGSLRSIRIGLTERGILTTTFDATQPPPAPDLRQLLPADVRQRVFRELPRAREARKVGAP